MIGWLKTKAAQFDAMKLRDRVILFVTAGALLLFVLAQFVVRPEVARKQATEKRVAAMRAELSRLQAEAAAMTVQLKVDPAAAQRSDLEGLLRRIAEADGVLAEFDRLEQQGVRLLAEVLAATPGITVDSVVTSAPSVAFQSKAVVAPPPKPAAGPSGAPPAEVPPPPVTARPPRTIYAHTVQVTLSGNYLALLPYLEKLRKLPAALDFGAATITVAKYPDAKIAVSVRMLSGRQTLRFS